MHVDYHQDSSGLRIGRMVIAHNGSTKSIHIVPGLGPSDAEADRCMRQRAHLWVREYCATRGVAGGGTG